MKKKFKVSDIVTIVLFLSIIFGFLAAFIIMPDKDSNGFETGLQRFPNANAAGNGYTGADYLLHGELADDFDEYFCDQFPLRKAFVSLKALSELSTGRAVSNGVLYSNGYLATVRFDAMQADGSVKTGAEQYSKEHVDNTLKALKAELDKLDIPVKVMLPPRTIDVYGEKMGYPTNVGEALNEQAKGIFGDKYVDILPLMQELQKDYYVYYRTDHHWTSVGAFYAYEALVNSLGGDPFEHDSFNFNTVYSDFKGTAYRNGNYFFLKGEEIQVADYEGTENFKVELGASLEYMVEKDGMYDKDALYGADPYNYFLHGKTKYVRITDTANPDKETLLVVKDSFAHSLVPLLARNYNIVMVDIDLNVNPALGSSLDLQKLAEQAGADQIVVLYNLQNVMENKNLAFLKAGTESK